MACESLLYRPLECLNPTVRELTMPDGSTYTYKFTELYEIFPFLERLYLPFEKHFDARPFFRHMGQSWTLPLVALSLYGLMITLVPKFTKNKPWNVNSALAGWNLFLALFSFIGMIRVVPHVIYSFTVLGLRDTLCLPPPMTHADGATGLWALMFTLSKYVELIDTLFVVLKGRSPIFLHWYHHVTVLAFCWATWTFRHSGPQLIAMNYSVHAIMYFYYFLMAVNAKPKWFNPIWITFTQIFQMFLGTLFTFIGFYYLSLPNAATECPGQSAQTLWAQALMYGSYLALFLQFMAQRFFAKGKKGGKGKKQQGEQASEAAAAEAVVTGTDDADSPPRKDKMQ